MSRELSDAWAVIITERIADELYLKRRNSLRDAYKILKTIPSGTKDSDLTAEQRKAWDLIERET